MTAAGIQSSEFWKFTNTTMYEVLTGNFEDTCSMPSSEISHFYLSNYLLKRNMEKEC